MLRPKEVASYTQGFSKIISDFIHRLRLVREPGGSDKENEVSELDNELFKWSFESVAEILFDKEINEEAQTFIKALGDFLAHAVEIYETQKFKKFFDNFDTMYDYAELFIGRRIKELEEKSCKPSKETGLGQVHGCTWRTHFFELCGSLRENNTTLCGWKFYLCKARNACSYAIPEGLVTRDPPP
ncbi:unnamed protein product [Pocillopora meandrina]|uniref:Uncharacterized protein n=1 Tax=Pocillopora meandrina TaxID=46732 RepID=A0AAU9WMR1_9CNID|nr:unnamed protein product [Pocillopora meandrina]